MKRGRAAAKLASAPSASVRPVIIRSSPFCPELRNDAVVLSLSLSVSDFKGVAREQ